MLSASDDILYVSRLDWTPTTKQKYLIEIKVNDNSGGVAVLNPRLILCACDNGGTCNYNIIQVCTFCVLIFCKVYGELIVILLIIYSMSLRSSLTRRANVLWGGWVNSVPTTWTGVCMNPVIQVRLDSVA